MNHKYINYGLKLLAIISLLSIGIFAQNNRRDDLSAQRWNLTEINSKRVSDSKAYLEITPQDRFAGNAGCNRMFGEVEINGGNINFGRIGKTRMFCTENGAMKLETDFTRTLEKVTRFEKSGNALKLYARNRLVLKFKSAVKTIPVDSDSVKLEDKKWVLEAVKNRALPKVETAPVINFDQAKGSAGGNTGCNAFGGNYAAKGNAIAVTNIISTMRACIEDQRMNVEREFTNGLEKANRFEIVNGKLNFYKDKILLLTFRAEAK